MPNVTAVAAAGAVAVTVAKAGLTKPVWRVKTASAPKLALTRKSQWTARAKPRPQHPPTAVQPRLKAASANAAVAVAVAAVTATAKAVKTARRAQQMAVKTQPKAKPQPSRRWPWPPSTTVLPLQPPRRWLLLRPLHLSPSR